MRCGERGVPTLWRNEENRGKVKEEEGKRQGFQQGVLLVEKQLDEGEGLRKRKQEREPRMTKIFHRNKHGISGFSTDNEESEKAKNGEKPANFNAF